MAMRERQGASPASRGYQPVALDSMDAWLPRAATTAEDDGFYEHHGIDWRALRQALGYRRGDFDWADVRDREEMQRAMSRAAGRRDWLRGASTITQQLAKNLYLSSSRNPLRKIKEAAIAYRLEWALSKQRILELYLNVAELGPNLWGVEAASRRYFGRGARAISLDQAALLMGTLPHPLTSNPSHRPGRARWRAQLIVRRLRGEDVVMPVEEEEIVPPPPAIDVVLPLPLVDSLPLDSLPRDSLRPDSLPR
jgi:monofunctional biosynthetic peptidoglycan transglycosylase